MLPRCSPLSDRHTPLSFWPGKTLQCPRRNVRGHVAGWGDPRRPMGKPLVWGPQASRVRRGWVGKVNGKGLLQVSRSFYHLRMVCQGEHCSGGGMLQIMEISDSRRQNEDRRGHTANVLLEFMQKSNNTKRNEMRQPRKVASTQHSLPYQHLLSYHPETHKETYCCSAETGLTCFRCTLPIHTRPIQAAIKQGNDMVSFEHTFGGYVFFFLAPNQLR